MRITVYDILEYLASDMTHKEILEEFPYLTKEDILACLSYAADAGLWKPTGFDSGGEMIMGRLVMLPHPASQGSAPLSRVPGEGGKSDDLIVS